MNSYFILWGLGVRIWWEPKYWHWFNIHDVNWGERRVYELGPVTIYRTMED